MMSGKACEQVRELLVEYADGELAASAAGAISDHLAVCPNCRRWLAALRSSLSAAQRTWEAAATELDADLAVRARRARRRVMILRVGLAVGAAAAVLALALLPWPRTPNAPSQAAPRSPSASAKPSIAQIESEIRQAGLAGEMLAAANLLAETPGGTVFALDRYRFVAEHCPRTDAARQARAALDELHERTTP